MSNGLTSQYFIVLGLQLWFRQEARLGSGGLGRIYKHIACFATTGYIKKKRMKYISTVPDMQSATDALHAETLAGVWPWPHLGSCPTR